jgi:hypothetical protein
VRRQVGTLAGDDIAPSSQDIGDVATAYTAQTGGLDFGPRPINMRKEGARFLWRFVFGGVVEYHAFQDVIWSNPPTRSKSYYCNKSSGNCLFAKPRS